MDRRSVQLLRFSPKTSHSCIHTKNVFSLVDLSPLEESFNKISKHVENCKICYAELKKFEQKNLATKVHIPKPQIDNETREIFHREVSDLFKAFDLNEKVLLKKKIRNKIKHIDSLGEAFIKNLGSKSMIKTYAFGAVLFVVLRQIFN